MAERIDNRWLWWVAGTVGVGLHALALVLWRVQSEPPPTAGPPPPYVAVLPRGQFGGGPLVDEQLTYLDPEPLFMPTAWNAGDQGLPVALRRQPDEVYRSFPAQWTAGAGRLPLAIGLPSQAPADPQGVLVADGLPRGATLGRVDRPVTAWRPDGWLEVRALADGRMAWAGPAAGLPAAARGAGWMPADFLVAVGRAGLVGDPVLENSSGSAEVDEWLRAYLQRGVRLGERLDPGLYRATVVP